MNQIITLLSDWRLRDPYVAMLKGELLKTLPDAQIVDITHYVDKFDLIHPGFCKPWSGRSKGPARGNRLRGVCRRSVRPKPGRMPDRPVFPSENARRQILSCCLFLNSFCIGSRRNRLIVGAGGLIRFSIMYPRCGICQAIFPEKSEKGCLFPDKAAFFPHLFCFFRKNR